MGRLVAASIAVVIGFGGFGGFGTTAADQSFASFTGQWRLTTADAPIDAPVDLLFTGPTPSQRILIERRLTSKVESESYSTDPSRPPMVHEARWLGPALVLKKPGYVSRGAGPSTADREEIWSVGPDDVLRIVATDRPRSGAARTTHLAYRRVPVVLRIGENLLDNPSAGSASAGWRSFGDARIESCDGNPCFAARNQGGFAQTVLLPTEAAGLFIVMIGSGASERINADGAITGLPYLHGTVATPDLSRFLAYLQGMGLRTKEPNAWVTMSGIFPVPPGAAAVIFRLGQGERRGVPQNGSAARFDDLGCYLFQTDAAARAFVAAWRGRR